MRAFLSSLVSVGQAMAASYTTDGTHEASEVVDKNIEFFCWVRVRSLHTVPAAPGVPTEITPPTIRHTVPLDWCRYYYTNAYTMSHTSALRSFLTNTAIFSAMIGTALLLDFMLGGQLVTGAF